MAKEDVEPYDYTFKGVLVLGLSIGFMVGFILKEAIDQDIRSEKSE